jgi:N-acetylmuramoyl-L-alanine amidase
MASAAGLPAARPAAGAITWDEAQAGYASQSRRLAEVLQVELAQKLPGSPDAPQLAAVRQLRIVAHPAVAVELASVAMEDPQSLARTALPLANAVVRAIAAYREATAKP